MIETDRGKEFDNSIFKKHLNNNNIKHHSRNTSLGHVFAEKFNRTIGDLPERPVFEKGDCIWSDVLPVITKQCENKKHFTKLAQTQGSLGENERYVY